MKNLLNQTHKWLTVYIAIGVFVQMFLAGIWHAEAVATPDAHVFFGLSLLLASLLALIAAAVNKLSKQLTRYSAVLFVLILLQPFLMLARDNGFAYLSAGHTLNAAFIGAVSGIVVKMVMEKQSEKIELEAIEQPVA